MADDPQNNARLPIISFEDFLKVDIRLGTIIDVKVFEEAKKAAYQLWIDFGDPLGVKKSRARKSRRTTISANCIGRRVAAVVNFEPKQIGKFMSEVLCLGFPDRNGNVVLLNIDRPATDGRAAVLARTVLEISAARRARARTRCACAARALRRAGDRTRANLRRLRTLRAGRSHHRRAGGGGRVANMAHHDGSTWAPVPTRPNQAKGAGPCGARAFFVGRRSLVRRRRFRRRRWRGLWRQRSGPPSLGVASLPGGTRSGSGSVSVVTPSTGTSPSAGIERNSAMRPRASMA